MSDETLYLSATELARRIRSRKLSSRALVETHIREIERVNPVLNAVVQERFELARREAQQADALVGSMHPDDLPPFHGVPCTIKENFALEGMPNTSGLVARVGTVVERDAVAVARMRAGGLIPLGVTNTSELCMWMETDNRVYGRTCNPYDPSRIVGGSSGGEGAIVGSGASPLGLGSDIGGSIRMPAFFNGVFGHKCTGGLVPNTGQYPTDQGPSARYCTTGPITRRAEDLHGLLSIMAGPDGQCEGAQELPLENPRSVDLRSIEVVNIPDDGRIPVSRELRDAQNRALEFLGSRGARVRQWRPSALQHGLEIWSSSLSQSGSSYADLLGNGARVNGWSALKDFLLGQSPYTLPSIALVLLENFVAGQADEVRRFVEMGHALYAEFEREIGPDAVFLYPSHSWAAPKHRVPMLVPVLWAYTASLNILEVPVTQVPLGLSRSGLPLGVQVGALRARDHLTMRVAEELERGFGGWVRPPRLAQA